MSHNIGIETTIITQALDRIYRKLKIVFFPRLLTNDKVPESDKMIIKSLILKPWNPYIRRHTALTEKVSKIREWDMKQHAGWVKTSTMINRYTHELGDTSNDAVRSGCFGIETKSDVIDSKLNPFSVYVELVTGMMHNIV